MRTRSLVAAALTGVLLAFPHRGAAEPTDPVVSDALAATLGSLRQTAPDAAGPQDERLGALQTSPELQQELSDLTAAIFTELVASTGGDPTAMTAIVGSGKSDPEAFAQRLSPETRRKLEALAKKLER
ncbi:MAG: hypothetical protein KIT14_10955 [bacterium]|nr:hypothetical protein [bacterium]